MRRDLQNKSCNQCCIQCQREVKTSSHKILSFFYVNFFHKKSIFFFLFDLSLHSFLGEFSILTFQAAKRNSRSHGDTFDTTGTDQSGCAILPVGSRWSGLKGSEAPDISREFSFSVQTEPNCCKSLFQETLNMEILKLKSIKSRINY